MGVYNHMESFGRVLLRVLPRVLLLKIQILDFNFSSDLSLGTLQTDPLLSTCEHLLTQHCWRSSINRFLFTLKWARLIAVEEN